MKRREFVGLLAGAVACSASSRASHATRVTPKP
jgi:hypothetical protein